MAMVLEGFQDTKETVSADARGRVTLGADAKDALFAVSRNELGQILLTPVVTVRKHEAWLWQDPIAMASVVRGLQQLADGQMHAVDFSGFANLDAED
jgi:hypothetical protein